MSESKNKRIAELEADRGRLREALEQIGNVLGTGSCKDCQCEGCAWETKEAVRLVNNALSATGQRQHPDTASGIYVASRASIPARAAMWREMRDQGAPILSSWIDESGEGETASFGELWQRIVGEIRSSYGLIFYAEPDDLPLKGAYVEVGMALACDKPVIVVTPSVAFNHDGKRPRPLGSWVAHPHVQFRDDIRSAIDALKEVDHPDTVTVQHCCGAAGFGREWPGEQRDVCPACEAWAEQREQEAERG